MSDYQIKRGISRMPKPAGYNNPYEEYYGWGGILWPIPGDKVIFKKTTPFWFIDMIADAKENLVSGQEYTISEIMVSSSWCGIKLVETGDLTYSLNWFKFEYHTPDFIEQHDENIPDIQQANQQVPILYREHIQLPLESVQN